MNEPSFFFSDSGKETPAKGGLEQIYSSGTGPSVLYRIQREGKFRVLKALKEKYRDDPFYRGLLRKEFEIGWEIDHPGICKTLGFREEEGLGPCIEMEWVDGCTLEALYARRAVSADLERQFEIEIFLLGDASDGTGIFSSVTGVEDDGITFGSHHRQPEEENYEKK